MAQHNQIIPAVKAVIVRGGRLLMLQRSPRNPISPGLWELPGGKLIFGEQLEQALHREICEETGLDAQVGRLLFASSYLLVPGRQAVVLCYHCAAPEGDVVLSGEHQAFFWGTAEETRKRLVPGVVEDFERHGILSLDELDLKE